MTCGQKLWAPERVADSHFILRNVARASVGEAESELPTGSDFPWLLLRQDTEA